MMDKMLMRKKAMDSMMKDSPSIMVEVKGKKPMMGMEEDKGEEGFVSMMVSPEEKMMIEKMRKGGIDEEIDEDSMPMPEMDEKEGY